MLCSKHSKSNIFSYDDTFKYLPFSNMNVIFETNSNYNLKYVICLLNSKLLTFRYQSIGKQMGDGFYEYLPNEISKFPIPTISLDEQKLFINFTDKLLNLYDKLSRTISPNERKLLDLEINNVYKQIDQSVYELYGLTSDEINIIEDELY